MSPLPPRSEGGGENTVPVALKEPERERTNAAPATTATAAVDPSSSSLLPQRHRVAIVWFRRDLRVSDNPALMAAAAEADYVVPLFIYAPEEEGQFQPGRCSRWWLRQSLEALSADLERLPCLRANNNNAAAAATANDDDATAAPPPPPRTSSLVLRRSPDSAAALAEVAAETGATALYFNHLYDPISLVRDNDAKAALQARGVSVRSFCGDCLFEPWDVLTKPDGSGGGGEGAGEAAAADANGDANGNTNGGGGLPFREFDPFWARLRELVAERPPPPPLGVPAQMPPLPLVESAVVVTDVDEANAVDANNIDNNNAAGATTKTTTTTTTMTTKVALAPVASLGLDDLGLLTAEEEQSNRQLGRRWNPGSRGAARRLSAFVARALPSFGADRAKTDRESTSRLSPHLHWGEVSVRTVFSVVSRVEAALAAASASALAVAASSEGGGGTKEAEPPAPNASALLPHGTTTTGAAAAAASTGTASLPQMRMEPVPRGQPLAGDTPATTRAGDDGRATTEATATETPAVSSDATAPAEYFLRQLAFREYARHMCFHFPFTHERALLEHLRGAPWRYDQRAFRAWRAGRTGYPLVDAGMRELWATGWLHNRARVVCACFLVKHLQLPWQWGLKHFWDALLDADLECCALGWQYVSGGLPDGLPFGNLLDLEREARRYDPDGGYVRAWLPALARLPDKWIHRPWAAPAGVLDDAGVEVGSGPGASYPERVVLPQESATALAAATRVLKTGGGGGAVARRSSGDDGLLPVTGSSVGVGGGPGLQPLHPPAPLLPPPPAAAAAAAAPAPAAPETGAGKEDEGTGTATLQLPPPPPPPPAPSNDGNRAATPAVVTASHRPQPSFQQQQEPQQQPLQQEKQQQPGLAAPGMTTASSPSAGAERQQLQLRQQELEQQQQQRQQQQQQRFRAARGSDVAVDGRRGGGIALVAAVGNNMNAIEGVSSNLIAATTVHGGGGGGGATAAATATEEGEEETRSPPVSSRRRTTRASTAAASAVGTRRAVAASKKKQQGDEGGGARKRTRGR